MGLLGLGSTQSNLAEGWSAELGRSLSYWPRCSVGSPTKATLVTGLGFCYSFTVSNYTGTWEGCAGIAAGKYEDLDPGTEVQACNLSAGPVGTSRPVQFSGAQKPASQLNLPGKLQTHDSVS